MKTCWSVLLCTSVALCIVFLISCSTKNTRNEYNIVTDLVERLQKNGQSLVIRKRVVHIIEETEIRVENAEIQDQRDVEKFKSKYEEPSEETMRRAMEIGESNMNVRLPAVHNRWPNKKIPFIISADFSSSEIASVHEAVNSWNGKINCLQWVMKNSSENNVRFEKSKPGCFSQIGYLRKTDQYVNLGKGCMGKGTILHEMMHSAGFHHEQARSDRDQYIIVHPENIIEREEHNFDKCSRCEASGTEYDYNSIMHYGWDSFSKNGKPTIECRPKSNKTSDIREAQTCTHSTIGQRRGLSANDIKEVFYYYNRGNVWEPILPHSIEEPSPGNCNFDFNLCGWIQDYAVHPIGYDDFPEQFVEYKDDFDFHRISGETPSPLTGPDGDHTSGNGMYVYIEASYPQKEGDRARIRTPIIDGEYLEKRCIVVFVSMYAADVTQMGSLEIFTKNINSRKFISHIRLDSSNNFQANKQRWFEVKFPVYIQEPYQVIFEATRGAGIQSDIAIDDFELRRHC